MATVEAKFEALGLAPPGDGKDLDRVWSETVQNMIRQHRDALARSSDPYAPAEHQADAKEQAAYFKKLLDKADSSDVEVAVAKIQEAEAGEQVTLTVGEEAP